MKKLHHYAVKYLDENGNTISYGYIETLNEYKPSEIINHMSQRILIDFEI